MNLRIEVKYALLIALLTLLWLTLETLVGLHDNWIAYHPYVTLLAVVIPILGTRQALLEKREALQAGFTFGRAFVCGLLITVGVSVLAIPAQLVFHNLINPDFFNNMITYAVANKKATMGQATAYFNLQSYVMQSVVGSFILGLVVSVVAAYFLRVKPAK